MSVHHIVPLKTYFQVLIALLVLTGLTVLLAPPVTGVDLGFLNAIVAITIASTKAVLVGAFFMHLKYDNKLYVVIILSGVFFLLLMFALSAVDIYSRVAVENPV